MNESKSGSGRFVSCAWLASAALLACACGDGGASAKPESATSAAPAKSAKAAESAKPGAAATTKGAAPKEDAAKPATGDAPAEKAVTTPEQQSYPMGSIKPIPDACSNAHAIIANAPESVGEDYAWQYSKQALLANQQFKTVSSAAAPGQVSFAVHQADASMSSAYVLVATCGDGSTCNHLAAMIKAVVKSSNPQPICGELPASLGAPKKQVQLIEGDPASNVPAAGDTIGMCARIGACTVATKQDTTDDVAMGCQKAPSKFKTECAAKYPCAEVMSCLGQ